MSFGDAEFFLCTRYKRSAHLKAHHPIALAAILEFEKYDNVDMAPSSSVDRKLQIPVQYGLSLEW
jgi:hypothetical protein